MASQGKYVVLPCRIRKNVCVQEYAGIVLVVLIHVCGGVVSLYLGVWSEYVYIGVW